MRRFVTILLLISCLPSIQYAQWTKPRLLNPSLEHQTTPFIAVGPNNEIIIVCADSPGSLGVYRSTNGGTNFVRTQVPFPSVTNFYVGPPLALSYDRQGNLFVVWKWGELDFPYWETLVLSKSTDSGTTFTTLWSRRRNGFRLQEYPFFVDANNTIHLIWDSTTVSSGFDLRYLRFVNGNPANTIVRVLPKPDTTSVRMVNMLVSGDSIHIALKSGSGDVSMGYYARSTNGGSSFSAYVVIDSLLDSHTLVTTTRGKAIFYGRRRDVGSTGVPILRFISDTTTVLSIPFVLPTKAKALPLMEGGGGVANFLGKSYLTYSGMEGSTRLGCYYEFADFLSAPVDSMFFPSLFQTRFVIDSLGGKYIVATDYPAYKVYMTRKDVMTSVRGESTLPGSEGVLVRTAVSSSAETIQLFLSVKRSILGSLKLYDILGREIMLVHEGTLQIGEYEFTVPSLNLAAGTYFAVLSSNLDPVMSKFAIVR